MSRNGPSTSKQLSETNDHQNQGVERSIEQFDEELQDVSFDLMKDLYKSDPDAAAEAIMGDGDGQPLMMFKMPKVKKPPTPVLPTITSPKLPSPDLEKWYPHRFDEDKEGGLTTSYLIYMKRAMNSEAEAIRNLSYAEQLAPYIGCPKTSELWTILNPLLTQISNLKLYEVASDIGGYLYHCPEQVHAYLKCFNRLKPFVIKSAGKFDDLEERSTQIVSMFDTTIASYKAHQEETLKFSNQVSNVSASLGSVQEVFERTMIKIKKLDLLPESPYQIPSAISVPSSTPQPQGQRVVLLDLSISGEYTGLYTIKIENKKIKSVIPPRNNPELTAITDLHHAAQEVFLNLSQAEILNRLSSEPEYRKAFIGTTLKERAPYLRDLCKGIQKRTNQWVRVENEFMHG